MFPVRSLLVAASVLIVGRGAFQDCDDKEVLSLLQVGAKAQYTFDIDGQTAETCSDLQNHGSYFSVKLEAGTPAQTFDVVADTGSDAVIIPSCVCRKSGECDDKDRCFKGTGLSSTFQIPAQEEIPLMSLEFGSGTIQAAVSTDVVKIGSVSATMQEGLLLMVDRHLDIDGPFEGILGLGQLQSEYSEGMDLNGGGASWDQPAEHVSEPAEEEAHKVSVPGFLRKAHVDRFSICFNDGESPGVLRLGTAKQEVGVPSVGTLHWGLDFIGFSICSTKQEDVLFCNDKDSAGCGAIPDSGTTVMLGPDEQVRSLFENICDQWDRCKKAAKDEFSHRKKEDVFQLVLARCEDWLHEGDGLDELPSIFMHLGNSEQNRTLELSAWSYVFESLVNDMDSHMQLLGDIAVSVTSLYGKAGNKTENEYICAPAFGTSDYSTSSTGAVWIVGTPLFYEYVVGYDRSTNPPEVTFNTDPCGDCGKSASSDSVGFLSTPEDKFMSLINNDRKMLRRSQEVQRRAPRKIHKPPRVGRHWHKGKHGKRGAM